MCKKSALFLVLAFLFAFCSTKKTLTREEQEGYESELNAWHAKRIEEVKAPNGWLNLVGLYWLHPGINSFGSDPKNDIVFPTDKLAASAGYFFLKDSAVTITVNKNVAITSKGKPVTSLVIFHPDSLKPVLLEAGSLRWNIIKRGSKYGIRLRDEESPLVKDFKGVDRFPVDPSFRVEATFEKSDSTKTIDITNVIGQTTAQRSPGRLIFKLNESEFRLDALEGNKDEFFVLFGDATSGKETYGGGRFLYVKRPDAGGKTIVDFNKAYNPPCVFTPYATCPLPPHQNILSIEVKVGEKSYGKENSSVSHNL
jgi:hypothetical protein